MFGLAKRGATVLDYQVAEIMVVDGPVVLPADSIQHAMAVMTPAKVRHLPVIDEKRVIGLVSIGDVEVTARREDRGKRRTAGSGTAFEGAVGLTRSIFA
jgi:CBS domain-containing protein